MDFRRRKVVAPDRPTVRDQLNRCCLTANPHFVTIVFITLSDITLCDRCETQDPPLAYRIFDLLEACFAKIRILGIQIATNLPKYARVCHFPAVS